MRKSLLVISLLLVTVFSYTGMAIAEYSFFWFNVGVRTYEDRTYPNRRGEEKRANIEMVRTYEDQTYLNRLDLEIVDENEDHVTTDIFQSVVLKGPSGEIIPLDDLTFVVTPYMGWGSNYDGWSGLWTFDGYFEKPYSGYKATLPEDLIEGTYTISCTDLDNNTITATKYFTGRMNLPIVRASSIKQHYDKNGNLLINWEGIYGGFPYLEDPNMTSSIRVCIFSDQSFWQLTVPAHMSTAFIPNHIINEIKSKGFNHDLLIQYRQQSNCNRSYSKSVRLR